jgi:arylsulfatase A-like enzyme
MRVWVRAMAAAVAFICVAAAMTSITTSAGHNRASLSIVEPGSAPGTRPNIVFVMTDDMRQDDLQHMPLTRRALAAEGMEFTEAISPHPLCCPARASLVTGQYAQNNGVQHNRGVHGGFAALDPAMEASTWFRHAGYRTGFVGKFLNGYGPRHRPPAGWTSWDALSRKVYNYVDFTMTNNGRPQHFADSYVTDVIAERTESLVRRFSRSGEPFVVYSWHLAPHYRIGPEGRELPPAAAQDRRRFRTATPAAAVRRTVDKSAVRAQPRYFRGRRPISGQALKAEHRARLRSLQSVDRAVEGLVKTLEVEGVLDRTYIVFTSDNGFLLGEHRFIGKNVLSDAALRVPLLIRGPGVAAGSRSKLPVSLVDLPVTFAALAGITPHWPVDGMSLVPTLRGDEQFFRDTTLVQTGSEHGDGWAYRGVRTERYLYARRDGEGLLYDRLLDPAETINHFDDPAYAPVRDELELRREQLVGCQAQGCNQAFGPLPEPLPSTEAERARR